MSHEKQFEVSRGGYGKTRSKLQVTINELNKVIRPLDHCKLEIGQYLLDKVFSGDFEKNLSSDRRKAAGVKRASKIPRISDRALRVKKIRRLKRP
jgi:hypothetical protein